MNRDGENMMGEISDDGQERSYCEELITPALATEYLSHNTHNRSPKQGRILAWADAMRNGQWRANGESIKFSKSGRLIDGQNRLMAVVLADTAVHMLVVRGLDDAAQETMDVGANRSMKDFLSLRGERSVNSLAATIRALYIWDTTKGTDRRVLGGSGQGGGKTMTLTALVLLDYFDANADLCRDLCAQTDHFRKATGIPTSILAPLLREMQRIDEDDAKDFMYRLENHLPSPNNMGEHDPLVQLHKWMFRFYGHRVGSGESGATVRRRSKATYATTEVAALIVKAWNAYRDGVPITQLRWRSGGSAPEAFPVMK